ncbi:hypothetical protein D3C76_1543770 [compost metagenome]
MDLGSRNHATLKIRVTNDRYTFSLDTQGEEIELGSAHTKYLSSEVAGGFTGVVIGLYAYAEGAHAEFSEFKCDYI